MKFAALFILLSVLVGCASSPRGLSTEEASGDYIKRFQADSRERSIHHYVELLAKQLFLTSHNIQVDQSIAVGTFLPMVDLGGKNMPFNNVLGQQIQESFVTLTAQAGLNVIEFKTANAIKVEKHQDVMLSRTLQDIDKKISADYYLTGTHHIQADSVVVNVRLIEVSSHNVIAAATDTIPSHIVWEQIGLNTQSTNNSSNNNIYQLSR